MDKFGNQQGTNDNFDLHQMRGLIEKLTPDEKNQVTDILRSCSAEMTMKRGIPLALLAVGGLHAFRDKLPANLRIGPQRWVFNGFLAVGCVTLSNILFQNTCIDRVKPKMLEFHRKYNQPGSAATSKYGQLREANRYQQQPDYAQQNQPNYAQQNQPNYAQQNQPNYAQQNQPNYVQEPTNQLPEQQISNEQTLPKDHYIYQESRPVYISGTPMQSDAKYTEPVFKEDRPRNKNNTYGDEGFS